MPLSATKVFLPNYVSTPNKIKYTTAPGTLRPESFGVTLDPDIQKQKAVAAHIKKAFDSDKEFIESYKPEVIDTIARKIVKKQPIIISIAGVSGSGKSTLTEWLEKALRYNGIASTIFEADNYFKNSDQEIKACGGLDKWFAAGHNFESPDKVDLPQLRDDLLTIASGQDVLTPIYIKEEYKRSEKPQLKYTTNFIIHEGIHALNDIFNDCSDVKIYYDIKPETLKKRWYERAKTQGWFQQYNDNPEQKRQVMDKQFNDMNAEAEKNVLPTRDRNANIIIKGECSIDHIYSFLYKLVSETKQIAA